MRLHKDSKLIYLFSNELNMKIKFLSTRLAIPTYLQLLFYLGKLMAFSAGCTGVIAEPPKSSDKNISNPSLSVADAIQNYDPSTNTYTFSVPANISLNSIAFSFDLPKGATSVPTSGTIHNFTNPVRFTITAEDGSKSVMTVIVQNRKLSDKSFRFFDFIINGIRYVGKIDEANSKVLVIVPRNTDLTRLSPLIGLSDRTTISPIETVSDFSKPKTYTLTAEDGTTRQYEVTAQIDNSIVNYAPEKYLGSFEKNLEGIRAKIEEVLKVPIPKINVIYMWNRGINDTDIGELINDKTVNDLYSLKDLKSNGSSGENEELFFQSKTDFTYPTKPVFSYAEPADSWFWTFSKKTLFIYDDNQLITKYVGKNVTTSFGVKLGRGKLGTNSSGSTQPYIDYFISIGWNGK